MSLASLNLAIGLPLVVPLVIPLLAALAARPLADRLPPAAASWLLAAGSLVLAVASSAALGLLLVSALVRVPFVAALGDLSARVISRDDSVSVPLAIIAGGLLATAVAAVLRVLWRRVTALAAASRHARSLPGAGQVVVTEDAAADAYTVPGWPGRIVITAGMLRVLSGPERTVLLAHERAHADGAHYLFTSAARLAAAANPLLRPVAAQVGYTVERWADERAAAASGDRPLTARTVARAALAVTTATPPPGARGAPCPVPVLGIVPGRAARTVRPGPVPRRVAALLTPPPPARRLLLGAVALVVALSAASALEAAASLHQLIELAQVTSAGSPGGLS